MNEFVDRLMPLLWTQAWQVAAVVAAITLVTRLKPVRHRPHLAYALWLLALVKCLTPPLVASPTSPFSWMLASRATPIVELTPAPIADFDPPQGPTVPDSASPVVLPQPEQPLVDNGTPWIESDRIADLPAAELPLSASPAIAGPVLTPRVWLVLVWLIVATSYFTMSLARYVRTRRGLIRCGHAATADVDEVIREISRSLRLRRSPRGIHTSQPFGPAVLGLLRPILVLPESATASLSPERLRLVLAHELIHLRRGDHWIGLVQFLVQALWWFNPLVWWANREMNRVREQCCDEEVLANLRCEPAGYAQTLLDIVRLGARSRALVLTAGVGAMHVTGQRLEHIMSDASRFHRAAPQSYWLIAALAAVLILPGAGLALVRDDEQTTAAPSTEKAASNQASKTAQPAAEKNTNDKPQDKFYDHPFTVQGRAYDQAGKPLEGATIYLVSTGVSKDKLLGETKTAQDGYYEFRDKKLPIWVAADKDWLEQGAFQVFGQAPGRAFAWQGMKSLLVDKRGQANSTNYLPGQRIKLDLTFSPPKRVSGRFIDEEGKGIAGVKVRLGSCDYLDHAGRESHVNNREFWAIKQAADIMPANLLTESDQDGRFVFSAVPPDVVCWLVIEHPNYADVTVYTSTAADPPGELGDGHPISKLPLELTLRKVRTISVQVVSAASGRPLAGVSVSGSQKQATGPSDADESDKHGNATLKLPPGEYKLVGDPPRYGTDFVRTYQDLIVAETPAEQTATLRINDGCVLVLKAIDADTGKPIAGVPFWYEMDEPKGARTGVRANTTHGDHPRTNDQGELRAVVYPGKRRYGVGFRTLPEGYRITTSDMRGKELDLVAGKTVVAEFKLQKQGANPAPEVKTKNAIKGREADASDTEKSAQVTIEARVADRSGKPQSGQRMVLAGRSAGEKFETFADSDAKGTIHMVVPRGIQHVSLSLSNTDAETVARFGPSDRAHLRLNGRLEGIDLYQDWKGIEITRYRCPTLFVKAVDQNGKTVDGFKPELTYFTTPANDLASIRGHRGDVYFGRQPDGRWRSEQLIPNKEFTLAVTAPGYQAAFEKLSLREAEVKELTLALSPSERADQPGSAKETSKKGGPAATFINSIGTKFALIPAGEFLMGSPKDEEGRAPPWGSIDGVEEMQHPVRITRPFYMSIYEVTQEEYEAVMGENPSRHSRQGIHSKHVERIDTNRFPAENMTWFEANDFCKRLSANERKVYRLPTEAEWEYACRAGTTTPFHFGNVFDGTQANMQQTYPRGTEAKVRGRGWPMTVGSYAPNAFGLYDMHGNVSEWCSELSASGYYAMSPRDDPPGVSVTKFNPRYVKEEKYQRAIRGGGLPGAHYARSASRSSWDPNWARDAKGTWDIGIRLVCEVPRDSSD